MGRFQALFDVLNPIFDSIIVSAGGRLKLPQENDAVAPTLSFGDGDTGFYEKTDDSLRVAISGTPKIGFNVTGLFSVDSTGAPAGVLKTGYEITAIEPSFSPEYSDLNTGIGTAGADILSLIAGGVEGLRLTESGSAVSVSGAVVNTVNGLSQLVAAPAASNSAGTAGQIAYDDTYFYVCIASSTWERVELASW